MIEAQTKVETANIALDAVALQIDHLDQAPNRLSAGGSGENTNNNCRQREDLTRFHLGLLWGPLQARRPGTGATAVPSALSLQRLGMTGEEPNVETRPRRSPTTGVAPKRHQRFGSKPLDGASAREINGRSSTRLRASPRSAKTRGQRYLGLAVTLIRRRYEPSSESTPMSLVAPLCFVCLPAGPWGNRRRRWSPTVRLRERAFPSSRVGTIPAPRTNHLLRA